MKKDFFKYGNLVAFVLMVVFNVLATTGVLGGVTTRDVSYMYKSLLTPADYAFSIWSVIYILLAVMVYLQMKKDDLREKLGYWFMVSCLLNIVWIIAWQFKAIALSFVIILALLLNLTVLMRSVKGYETFESIALGLYTGWINVAMLADLGAMYSRYNWNWLGVSGQTWAVLGLIFGIAWICFFIFMYSNIYYAMGACWGYWGITAASGLLSIKITAILGMVFFAGSAIFAIMRKKCIDVEGKC